MKKNKIAYKLQMDLKYVDSNGGNVQGQNPKSMQIFFLENCWYWARKRASKFFIRRDIHAILTIGLVQPPLQIGPITSLPKFIMVVSIMAVCGQV